MFRLGATVSAQKVQLQMTIVLQLRWPRKRFQRLKLKGEWVSALVEMYGFKAGTDKPINMRWLTMVRLDKEIIVESYPAVDFVSLFEQLGQLPPNSFELLLSGTVLK